MTGNPWKYSNKMRHGVLVEWTSKPLPGGCSLISIQCMWESHENRFPPEEDLRASRRMHRAQN
jgi:hypothetical protein